MLSLCKIITPLNSFSRDFEHGKNARIAHFLLETKRFSLKSLMSFQILVEFCAVLSNVANFISDFSETKFASNKNHQVLHFYHVRSTSENCSEIWLFCIEKSYYKAKSDIIHPKKCVPHSTIFWIFRSRAPDGPAHGPRWADVVLKIFLRQNELTQFFHDILRGEWAVFPLKLIVLT